MRLAIVRSALVLSVLSLLAGAARAQDTGWQPFLAVTPAHQGKSDLDSGGDFTVGGVLTRFGVNGSIGNGNRAGLTLSYDYLNYSFSDPVGFGNVAPWSIVQRYGVAAPLSFGLGDGWVLGIVPSVNWFKENGADTGDSLAWGAILSGAKRFDNGNMIGLGVGVYDLIEDTVVFPFILVNWRLSEHWRLVNPLSAGPSGPAGLELEYDFGGGWRTGLGAAFRSTRFRLSETGAVPNGVGEERDMPVVSRVTRELGPQMALHFFAGAVVGGQLRVENSSGGLLHEEDFDPAPLIGLTFMARF
jgi:hypothetical protein